MVLHQSLLDLSELAPHCQSRATARGLLAEAQDILRNAVAHQDDEIELAHWYSRLITDIVRSPGVNSPVRLTGAAARGDQLPSMPVEWIGQDADLLEVFSDVGLRAQESADSIAARVDASLPLGNGSEQALLEEALAQRPPALKMVDGLPDRDADVDIKATLLSPIAAIARWAAPGPRPTVDRLAIGVERDLLSAADAESLDLAWRTGYALELRRWYERVSEHSTTLRDLPPLDRTAYGSACRIVSATFESIARRAEEYK
ncbi:putative nucleotidyltransferase substrate binding domain-containing protein [Corynebacterium yonathiae]|uniref:Nucleotidyltransferase substrate binding domain-containing protein n=1 Tax=Corynebacterium yonathiae TaxID=2913504 RepID=A0ABU8Y227_9CORY|nr:putative nucleotidyltransferase substrate binding domain-containing protein [uncultured Corynebacterium sp.]